MSAFNWEAGDPITRSRLNQPFFMQSGTAGGGALGLRFSPGRMYFPHTGVLWRQVSQSHTFLGLQANTNYGVFVTGDGDFTASGYTGGIRNPGAPVPNAQYIGSFQFGAAVNDANLRAPWTTPSGVFEGRGEYVAIDQAVPRVRVGQGITEGGLASPATMRNRTFATVTTAAAANLVTVMAGEPPNSYSVVHGHVSWTPSGTEGTFGMDVYVTKEGALDFVTADSQFFGNQEGDESVVTTAFSYVSVVSGTGVGSPDYVLSALLDNAICTTSGATARIRSYALIVEPGRKTSLN